MNEMFGYGFSDARLLDEALTTPSYRHDYPDARDNQRLEFLGDSVLGFIAAVRLYGGHPGEKEGELTVRRAHMVSASALCAAAAKHGFAAKLKRNRCAGDLPDDSKIIADAVEAVVGAAYIDGGTAAAEKIFDSLGLMEYAKESGWNGNPKGELQVRCQARGVMPSYELVHVAGKAHEPVFTVKVSVAGVGSAVASAGSRKKADSLAAAQMLEKL